MNKLLPLILGFTILAGCSPSRSELMSNIDELNSELSSLQEEEKERTEQIDLLCGLYGETLTLGQAQYLGNGKYRDTKDGSIHTMEDFEKQCLDMTNAYGKVVQERNSN